MKKRILSFLLAMMMLVGTILATGTSAEEAFYPDAVDHWAKEHIVYVSDKGMMNGIGDGLFGPDDMVSRAMVVTVLYRLAGEPSQSRESKFPDLREDWYKDAVAWGAAKGIVKGYDDGTFGPDNDVSRQELVTFIGRYAELNYVIINGEEPVGFVDAGEVESWALEYFKWAVSTKLVNGVTDDTLQPTAGATRAQFATIMHRYDTNIEAFEYELKYNEPTMYSQYTEKEYPLRDDADFFVSTTGDDANDGKTKETAFKTFERARDAVREFKKTATDEIVVAFMAGNYGYLDNITFTAEDSGTEEVPITYCKYGDGEVIFHNGVHIDNERFIPIDESEYELFEEKAVGNIYKADISDLIDKIGQFDVLFSGDKICWEARYPNKDSSGTDNSFTDMSTREDQFKSIKLDALAKKTADKFRTVDGLKVTGMLRTGWLIDTFLVESYDKETGILAFDFDNPDFYSWKQWPMEAWTEEEMANGTGEGFDQDHYNQGDRGIWVLMYEDRANDTIIFHNIPQLLDRDGEYWIDTKTMTLYVYNPVGDYTIANGGQMMSISSDYVSFVGLEFRGSTADYMISLGATNVTFDLCEFRDFNSLYGIQGGGANNAVTNCEFEKFGRRAMYMGITKVYNNYFHNYGWNDPYYVAVTVGAGAVVSHNYFKDGAGGGIIFGEDAIIEYNVFDNLMVNNKDQGLVYTGVNGYRGAEVRYNLFMNTDGGEKFSIYLDDGTSGVRVHGNIFYSAQESVVMNGGRDNEVYDNVIIASGGFSAGARIQQFYDSNHSYFNRIFVDTVPSVGTPRYELWQENWPWALNYHTDASKIDEIECVFYNKNIIRDNHLINIYDDLTNPNLIYEDNAVYSTDENRLFVNPTIGDYRIREDADFADIPFEKMGRE